MTKKNYKRADMTKKNYEIEKDIPRWNYWDELTAKMEVGDSVLFPSRGKSRRLTDSLKGQGFKFTGQAVPDGFRVWKEGQAS